MFGVQRSRVSGEEICRGRGCVQTRTAPWGHAGAKGARARHRRVTDFPMTALIARWRLCQRSS